MHAPSAYLLLWGNLFSLQFHLKGATTGGSDPIVASTDPSGICGVQMRNSASGAADNDFYVTIGAVGNQTKNRRRE